MVGKKKVSPSSFGAVVGSGIGDKHPWIRNTGWKHMYLAICSHCLQGAYCSMVYPCLARHGLSSIGGADEKMKSRLYVLV
jgi:hypothetical protein